MKAARKEDSAAASAAEEAAAETAAGPAGAVVLVEVAVCAGGDMVTAEARARKGRREWMECIFNEGKMVFRQETNG